MLLRTGAERKSLVSVEGLHNPTKYKAEQKRTEQLLCMANNLRQDLSNRCYSHLHVQATFGNAVCIDS